MKEKTGRTNLEEREKCTEIEGIAIHIISLLSRKIKQGIFSPFSPFRCFLGRVDILYHDKPALALSLSGRVLFCFMSSLRRSIHLSLGLPLGRHPSIWVFSTNFATLSSSLRSTWPNHDSRFFMRKVFTGFMSACSWMVTFPMWSFLVFPCIQQGI